MKNYLFGLTCVSYLIHLTCVKILWVSEWKIKLLSFPRRHSHLQSLHPGVAVSPSHKMLLVEEIPIVSHANCIRVPLQLCHHQVIRMKQLAVLRKAQANMTNGAVPS